MKIEQRESFLLELLSLAQGLESEVLALEEHADGEHIGKVFRSAHNIKSAAAMLGLKQASAAAHELESHIEELRRGARAVSAQTITQLLSTVDELLARLASEVAAENQTPTSSRPATTATTPARRWQIGLRLEQDALSRALDPLMLLAAAADLGSVISCSVDDSQLPELEALDPYTLYLGFTLVLETTSSAEEIRALFLFAEGGGEITVSEALAPPEEDLGAASRDLVQKTLPVNVQRIDALVELATELLTAAGAVEKLWDGKSRAADGRAQTAFSTLRRLIGRMQEAAMTMRLVPLSPTFALVRRYVRDQALAMGKQAEVVLHGEQIEIDKSIAEKLLDPLKHLVRNALDHGIEAPDVRQRSGKPRRGRLLLEARQAHGQMVLDVSDDGRGFDLERIREVAIARGLISPGSELTESDAAKLIFSPGFSTAQEVGDLSGRGLGLDIVHRNIIELGGDLRVRSQPGTGVIFTLCVPLTLAVIEGPVVRCGSERLVIPLDLVLTIARSQPQNITRLPGGGKLLRWQDRSLPLVSLEQTLRLREDGERASQPPIIVIIQAGEELCGLGVDEVLSQEPVLLKGLHRSLRIGEGVLAAAVMGDGGVALVLDVLAIDGLYKKAAMHKNLRQRL